MPLALLFLSNRVLNPALVPLEVALNAYVLFVNREALPRVWRRTVPMMAGLLPGIAIGTMLVAHVSPAWLKFGTFVALIPLILTQAAGYRRPVKSERTAGFAFGSGNSLNSCVAGSNRPITFARCPVYQTDPSGATAGS